MSVLCLPLEMIEDHFLSTTRGASAVICRSMPSRGMLSETKTLCLPDSPEGTVKLPEILVV